MDKKEVERVDRAIVEAERFLRTAKAFIVTGRDPYRSRERAAMKRASLDLTASLAELRRSR